MTVAAPKRADLEAQVVLAVCIHRAARVVMLLMAVARGARASRG
jgi:hypothetical protein